MSRSNSRSKLSSPEGRKSSVLKRRTDSIILNPQNNPPGHLSEYYTPQKLLSKPTSPKQSLTIKSGSNGASPNRLFVSSSQGPRLASQVRKRSLKNIHFADETFNTKVNQFYDKILNEDSKLIYEPVDEVSLLPRAKDASPYENMSSPMIETLKHLSPTNQRDGRMASYPSQSYFEQASPEADGKSPMTGSNKDLTFQNREHFVRPSIKGSRFTEILDLRQKNFDLSQENRTLKNDIKNVDEFDLVLRRKTKFEDFNEKRCDMLKACINKQRRYIQYSNTAIKLQKKFYKDLKNVLNFLLDLNDKYLNSGFKMESGMVPKKKTKEPTDISNKVLADIYTEVGTKDALKLFIQNFNEAYSKVKQNYEKNAEIDKVFTMVMEAEKEKNALQKAINPEVKSKIRYNYMLSQFIQQYKKIFPLYTVFDEFELKDKNDFADFINHLTVTAEKVDDVFKKVKNFDMLNHVKFSYNEDIPDKLISNAADFKYYFNKSNKTKRIYLNSKDLLDMEKSLSSLLNELVTFHNNLATRKESVSLESIVSLQENIRANIEDLLLLGITTTSDYSTKDKIVIVNNGNEYRNVNSFVMSVETPKKDTLFEIYNQEYEAFKKFDNLKNSISNLLQSSIEDARKISSDPLINKLKSLTQQFNHIETNHHEFELISKMKDLELTFRRKYAQEMLNEIDNLKKFVNKKMMTVDELGSTVSKHVKDLMKLYDSASSFAKDPKRRNEFAFHFEAISKKLMGHVNRILSKQNDEVNTDLFKIEGLFEEEVLKIKGRLNNSEQTLKEMSIQIVKAS